MENEVVAPIMHAAKQMFLDRNRDLIACIRGGAAEVFERIAAEMSLDDEAEESVNDTYRELTSYSDESEPALSHPNLVVRDVSRGFMKIEFYKQIALSFLRLTANGTLTYAIALTDRAEEQKYEIGVAAGCIRPRAAIQREAQAQTAAEDLTDEVTKDWNGRLTVAAIQAKKKSNQQYGARLTELLDAGTLQ